MKKIELRKLIRETIEEQAKANIEKGAQELADMSNASQLMGTDFPQMVKNFNSKGGDYDAWKEFEDDWLTVTRAIEIALEKGQE